MIFIPSRAVAALKTWYPRLERIREANSRMLRSSSMTTTVALISGGLLSCMAEYASEDSVKLGLLLGRQTNREDRTGCAAYDTLSGTAEDEMVKAGAAVGAQHYQGCAGFLRLPDDLLVGYAADDGGLVIAEFAQSGTAELVHHI